MRRCVFYFFFNINFNSFVQSYRQITLLDWFRINILWHYTNILIIYRLVSCQCHIEAILCVQLCRNKSYRIRTRKSFKWRKNRAPDRVNQIFMTWSNSVGKLRNRSFTAVHIFLSETNRPKQLIIYQI